MTSGGKLLRLVSWCQILAGAFMLIDVVGVLVGSGGSALATLNKAVFVAIGTLCLVAGVALRRPGELAWRASVALQLVQLPVLLLGSVLYRPGIGAFIPWGVYLPGAHHAVAHSLFEFSIGVDFAVSNAALPGQPYMAVNVAAAALLLLLLLNRPASINPL